MRHQRPVSRPSPRCLAWLLGAAAALMPTLAQAQPAGHDRAEALSFTLGFETIRLPGRERLGLLGGALLFEAAPSWWLGPAVYGAVTGERGGLFTGGLEVQRRWRLGERSTLVTSVYAGGGGGGGAPVGGGLMLRPAITALQDFGALQAGLSWSQVRFPDGDIRSNQAGVVLAWDGRFRYADPARAGQPAQDEQRSGIGFDRMAATFARYTITAPGRADRRIDVVGARLDRRADDGHFTWGLEAAGAASGGAAGYMEILASAGWDAALLPSLVPALRAGVRGAAGLGGGGAVPTGGGALGKAMLTLSAPIAPQWSAGLEAGLLRSGDSAMRATLVQAWLALDLEPARGPDDPLRRGTLARTEWAAALQHNLRVQREDGSREPLDTVGLKLNRYLNDHVYLSGQAHSAFAGGAGAYSIGLVGVGAATAPAAQGWGAGAELLVGAAGGGGVATAGGALVQAVGWAGWSDTPGSQWRLGAGAVRSLRGGLSSPIVELSWVRAFAQSAP